MNKTGILLLTTIFIPLINCLAIRFCQNSVKVLNFLTIAFPILFISNLAGLYQSFNYQEYNNIDLIKAYQGLSISFSADSLAINFLFLLSFIWLIFSFYLRGFLQINDQNKIQDESRSLEFQKFFAILIALINFIILAKNLVTILFFFNCLIIWHQLFAADFMYRGFVKTAKKKIPFSNILSNISSTAICNFILYLQPVLLFLAIIITYKFSSNLEFNSKTAILANVENYQLAKYLPLFLLYFASLFLLNLFCAYLLYRNINFNPLEILIFLVFSFGFVQLFIFYKLLTQIFGLELFGNLIKVIGGKYFYYIFSFNMLITASLAIFGRNLKSSFFYLFFNQLTASLFAIFLLGAAENNKIMVITTNFILSQLLVFLSLSNMVIFLRQSKNKQITGLFYKLKITVILMIFAVLNIIGIAPSIGMAEKLWVIKALFWQQSPLAAIIFVGNQLLLIIFAIRLFYSMFLSNDDCTEYEISLAKDTDLDSNLILSPSIVALFLILLLFFMVK